MIDKSSIVLAAVLAALSAQAFDFDAWTARRDKFAAAAAHLAAEYAKIQGRVTSPAKDVVVPVDTFDDGTVKTLVTAKEAQIFMKEGFVWGRGVTVKQMADAKRSDAEVEADSCLVDRNSREGWVDGRAWAKYRADAELEGDGVYLDFSNRWVSVSSNTTVHADGRVITGRSANYDGERGVIELVGDVHLVQMENGDRYDFRADRAYAFLSGTNELRRVVASGNVSVVGDRRSGYCDRMTYSKAANRVVMYGADGWKARLSDSGRSEGDVEGDRITFWLDAEQVEVEKSSIRFGTSGLKLPKGAAN